MTQMSYFSRDKINATEYLLWFDVRIIENFKKLKLNIFKIVIYYMFFTLTANKKVKPGLGQLQRKGSSCLTFGDSGDSFTLHLVWVSAVIFLLCWEHMRSFSGESSLISMWQTEVTLLSWSYSHSSSCTMCFSSVHYYNYGYVTPNLCLFVDFSWISIFTWKISGLSWQWFHCPVWSYLRKCLFWLCWGIENLVPSQEQLWTARRGAPEGDEQLDQKFAEEHHQREKHQQLHVVAGRRGPRRTHHK